MSTDIRVSNGVLDRHLHAGCGRKGELRVNAVHLWRRGAHEHERHDVLCRIASLQMSRSIIRMARRGVMLVGGQPMVVVGVVVIGVSVSVQQRGYTGRRNQRRDEQQRRGTVHTVSV